MPVVTSRAPVVQRVLLNSIVSAFDARPAGKLIDTPVMRLFTAGPLPITPDSIISDYTECIFDGYSAAPLTLSGNVNLPSGDGVGSRGVGLFTCNGPSHPEVVLGYLIEDVANNLAIAEYFDTPVPINVAGDFISMESFTGLAFEVTI